MTRGKTKEKKCLRCKEIFHPRVADLKRGWGKFCSKSCKAVTQHNNKEYNKKLNWYYGQGNNCDSSCNSDKY